jgi:hypothetical protein
MGASAAANRSAERQWVVWLAWSLCLLVVALIIFTEGVYVAGWDERGPDDRFAQAAWLTLPLPFSVIGTLIITRRPGNRIGASLLGGAAAFAGFQGALTYVTYGLERGLPGLALIGWIANWIWVPALVAFMLLLLLYPDGRPLSRRWELLGWGAAAYGGVALAVMALYPDLIVDPGLANPVGLRGSWAHALRQLAASGVVVFIPMFIVVASAGSLLVRFRRARGVQRQQLKWFAYAVALIVGAFILATTLLGDWTGVLLMLAVWTIPVAIGVAILRYRLYDIDRLISRTLVYGLLTALLATVYVGVVLLLGQLFGGIGAEPPRWAVAGATLAVAALFQPARRRIQAVVDRRFNRRRYDAAKTIEAFSTRLRDQVDLDTLSAELLTVVEQTMQPTGASLWLRPSPHGRAALERDQRA